MSPLDRYRGVDQAHERLRAGHRICRFRLRRSPAVALRATGTGILNPLSCEPVLLPVILQRKKKEAMPSSFRGYFQVGEVASG